MKKTCILAVSLLLALALTACGQNESQEVSSSEEASVSESAETTQSESASTKPYVDQEKEAALKEEFSKSGFTIVDMYVEEKPLGENDVFESMLYVNVTVSETASAEQWEDLSNAVQRVYGIRNKYAPMLTVKDGNEKYWSISDSGASGFPIKKTEKPEEKDVEKESEATKAINERNPSRHDEYEAFACAQNIVESKLTSPSTAEFCPITEAEVVDLGNGEYMVSGWVDTGNAFGGIVRHEFVVTYTATAQGYKNGNVELW